MLRLLTQDPILAISDPLLQGDYNKSLQIMEDLSTDANATLTIAIKNVVTLLQ